MNGIYKILNTANNKFYIGSSTNIEHRWRVHQCYLKCKQHPNKYLQYAWDKYGSEYFEFSVLKELEGDPRQEEQRIILETKCYDREIGYNLSTNTISPMEGKKHSAESISRMSEAKKGKKNHFYGKTHTEETKQRISKVKKNIPLDPEHKKKVLETAWKKGEQHINAVLTEQIVYDIKMEYRDTKKKRGFSMRKSRELGVNYTTIQRIINNETWKHITVEEK
jgi:group I intron endonuclease